MGATMKSGRRLVLSIFVFLLFLCPVGRAGLQGACARVDITPPLGIELIGSYGKPSDAVMDELYAKALVLHDGDNTVALVSVDLLYAPLEEITNPVRAILQENLGIPGRNAMICATHTHSGPEVFTKSKLPPKDRTPAAQLDQAYLQTLVRKIADTVLIAHQNMREVRIGVATGALPEVLYNRRPTTSDGRAQMVFTVPAEVAATRRVETSGAGCTRVVFTLPPDRKPLSFGPVDPAVFALRVEDTGGTVVGSVIGFGCHPVSIYPSLSTTISADYPAFATRVVEQVEGGVSLFALGLAGNTVPLQRGAGPCAQIGKAVGAEALKRLQLAATTGAVTLKALSREVVFPIKKAASTGSADAQTADSITTEIQVLKLGDIYVLGLPGEVLVEVGLEIKARAGLKNLLVLTCTNDTIGYVCPRRAYEEGGYEPQAGTNLAPGAGETMVEQTLALLSEVGRDDRGGE
jgi:neutral ceramidase